MLIRMPIMGPSVSASPIPPGQSSGIANKPLFPSAAAIVNLIYVDIYFSVIL